MSWSDNLATVRTMLACVSAGDVDGYLAHLADDAEYAAPYYPQMEPRRGRAAIAAMFDGLSERFASVSYELADAYETVDPDVVICEVRGDNQVRGADRRYRNHYVMVVRFRSGRVVVWTEYSDPTVYHRAVNGPA